jgi:hypothetical protein
MISRAWIGLLARAFRLRVEKALRFDPGYAAIRLAVVWRTGLNEPVENAVESVYPRQCQMNLRHLKSIFLMRLI